MSNLFEWEAVCTLLIFKKDSRYRKHINGEYLKNPSIREQAEQVIYAKKVDDAINRLIEELRKSATIKIIEVKEL